MLLALIVASSLLAPSLAQAVSGSLYPAGDTLDIVNARYNTMMLGSQGGTTCNVDLGAARIPAEPGNRNASGPIRVTLSTNPTFEGCRTAGESSTITSAGTWTAEFAWGSPAPATINVPARGIIVRIFFLEALFCEGTNNSAMTATGSWQNGFTSPAFVNSALSLRGSTRLTWTFGESGSCEISFGSQFTLERTSVEVRDATNARAVVLVGP
ncbi:MAG: hypothetical protein ACTHOE_14190 [Conexibacter sp.]